jgi:hypothetical protein
VFRLVLQQEARTENSLRLGFFYTIRPRASRILRNVPR